MSETDYRLYLCTNCCRRCYWGELSRAEHRCQSCLLPLRRCAICGRQFEPRSSIELHCKRCEFHFNREASDTPPPVLDMELDTDSESEREPEPVPMPMPVPVPEPVPQPIAEMELYGEPRQHSMSQRWDEIKKAAGL